MISKCSKKLPKRIPLNRARKLVADYLCPHPLNDLTDDLYETMTSESNIDQRLAFGFAMIDQES